MDRDKLQKAITLKVTEGQIKKVANSMMDEELEKAHKEYLREKRRIIANLQGLKIAIRVIADKHDLDINKSGVITILNNTIEFIKKGEV
jgi:hypothetical protein